MNASPLERIKKAIESEVFVTQKKERIIPENSSWLMDFRRISLDPHFLDDYTEVFYERFKDELPFQVGGMEVAAIPLVSAIVMKMREKGRPVNGFFIRKSRKKTGLLKMVEGRLTNDPIILVDDLMNNGYTFDRQVAVLEETKVPVKMLFTILRFRENEAYQRFMDRGIQVESLFTLADFKQTLVLDTLPPRGDETLQPFEKEWFFKSHDPHLEVVLAKSGIALDEERLYFGSDRGVLWALHQGDGKIAWQYQVGLSANVKGKEIFSTPALYNRRVYFGAYDGNVYCLDAKTGKRCWVSFAADWVHGGIAIAPELGLLFVPMMFGLRGKQGGLAALGLKDGKTKWRVTLTAAMYGTPLYVPEEKKLFAGGEDGTLFALNAENGKILWSFKTGGAIKESPAYDARSRAIIFSSFDGNVYTLSSETGLLIWKFENGGANYSSPYIQENKVYVASLDKEVYCLNLKDGTRQWSFSTRARIFAAPRMYDNRLYLGSNDARLYEIDPHSGKQIGFFQAVERITNPVVLLPDGRLLLQTYANEIYCLKRKD